MRTLKKINPEISVIMITRNRRQILKEAIKRLLKSRDRFDEVIVVDNGSSDGTPDMVRTQFPDFNLIQLPDNFGIPEARNIGALNASNEYLLFLDDDGVIDSSNFPHLAVKLGEDEQLAVITFQVKEYRLENEELPMVNGPTYQENDLTLEPTYTFCGGASMVKKSAFVESGMFPEHFHYSHEEDDLSFRLLADGYWIAFCPQVIFHHYQLTKRDSDAQKRKVYHYYRNRQYVLWRNLPGLAAVKESLATFIGGSIRTIFTPYFFSFLAGSAEAFSNLIQVVRHQRSPLSRSQYANYRKLDEEFMGYRYRLTKLWLDLWQRRRLDWI